MYHLTSMLVKKIETETEGTSICVWNEDRIWDLSSDEKYAFSHAFVCIQRHWQSCSGSMLAGGNPPIQGPLSLLTYSA